MRRHLLYNILCLLLLTACEHEIPYNGEYQDAKLLVEAFTCAGEDSLVCCVGRTYFILDDKPTVPEELDGLDISLEGTSGTYTVLSDSTDGRQHYMKLSRPVKAGEELKLTVSHPHFGTACAKETVMPDFVPERVSYEVKTTTQGVDEHTVTLQLPDYSPRTVIGLSGRLYVTLTSIYPLYDTDYTQIGWDTIVSPYILDMLDSHDPVFENMKNGYIEETGYFPTSQTDWLLLMRPDYPAGKQIEVYMRAPTNRYYPTGGSSTCRVDSFLLEFEMKSEAYNLYQASMEKYQKAHRDYDGESNWGEMFSSMGLEETVSVYNNVENGYGAFISKTKTKIRIK